MTPMSSSSNHNSARPLARSSSFLGAIKNIVTAPLTWFGVGEEAQIEGGKRKHVFQPSINLNDEDHVEDGSSRSKRIRIHSPEFEQQPSAAYLDPPSTAFHQKKPNPLTFRSSSASAFGRNQHGISRTMSVDPPSTFKLQRDVSMASIPSPTFPPIITRDMSMPALSTQPSFRMRSSLTPQPSGSSFGPTIRRSGRESEPPPLTSLVTNPVFVRAPSEQHQTASEATTLGSLSNGHRNVISFFHKISLSNS